MPTTPTPHKHKIKNRYNSSVNLKSNNINKLNQLNINTNKDKENKSSAIDNFSKTFNIVTDTNYSEKNLITENEYDSREYHNLDRNEPKTDINVAKVRSNLISSDELTERIHYETEVNKVLENEIKPYNSSRLISSDMSNQFMKKKKEKNFNLTISSNSISWRNPNFNSTFFNPEPNTNLYNPDHQINDLATNNQLLKTSYSSLENNHNNHKPRDILQDTKEFMINEFTEPLCGSSRDYKQFLRKELNYTNDKIKKLEIQTKIQDLDKITNIINKEKIGINKNSNLIIKRIDDDPIKALRKKTQKWIDSTIKLKTSYDIMSLLKHKENDKHERNSNTKIKQIEKLANLSKPKNKKLVTTYYIIITLI